MAYAAIDHLLDSHVRSTDEKEVPMTALETVWNSIQKSRQKSSEREIARVLQMYDDNALQSLGYDAEDIARLRKSAGR